MSVKWNLSIKVSYWRLRINQSFLNNELIRGIHIRFSQEIFLNVYDLRFIWLKTLHIATWSTIIIILDALHWWNQELVFLLITGISRYVILNKWLLDLWFRVFHLSWRRLLLVLRSIFKYLHLIINPHWTWLLKRTKITCSYSFIGASSV